MVSRVKGRGGARFILQLHKTSYSLCGRNKNLLNRTVDFMRAAVLKENGVVQVEEAALPVPKSNELRIAVSLAGICGSDSSMFLGKLAAPFPVVPGHEAVGMVDFVGESVSRFRQGQRVTIHPNYYCGECDLCRKGLTNICRSKIRLGVDIDGVFADYVVVPEKAVHLVPDDLSDEVAVFAEPLAVGLHGIKQSGLKQDDRTLVFGAGVIGQLILQLTLQRTSDVTVCDLAESRLQLASKMGAQRVFSEKEQLDKTQGEYDVIFETSGAPAALEQCIQLAAPGATIVLLGLPGKDHSIPTVSIVRKELTIVGSMIYTNEIEECLRLLAEGKIATEPLVSGVISPEELQSTLEDFNSPQRMKTLVKM